MRNDFISNFFGFNRQQRNGLFVLLLISFLLLVTRLVYPMFMHPSNIVVKNLPLYEKKIGAIEKSHVKLPKHNEEYKTTLFSFDPNTVSLNQLLKLGFSEKRAGTFIKFRNRGFVFRKKEDLQKVYGISGHFYETLEPYISIAGKSVNTATVIAVSRQESPKNKKAPAVIELNTADSAALESLNGIGSTYARRIIKYRTILGGYVAVEQLKEVYGMNEEVLAKIKVNLSVDPTLVKKINLNKDDFKVINKHPYLSYELTKAIFNFRRKTPLTAGNLNEIVNDPALCQKLLPYLAFE